MRVTVVHNPRSGDDDHAGEQLIGLVSGAGHQVDYYRSTDRWRAALDGHPDLVAVAGGDGTVSEVATATAGRGIPVTILPTGTANNIAGWLGLSGVPVEELVAGWTRASLQPFDIGVARGPWGTRRFLESLGVGLLAGLMSEIDVGGSTYVNRLDGRDTRIAAAREVLQRVLARSKAVSCELRLDELDISGEFLLVEVLNFGTAGPNLRLAPDADGADGVLDVVLIEEHERVRIEKHLSTNGADPLDAPVWRVHKVEHVTLRCQHCVGHFDDELWADPDNAGWLVAEASVEAAALTFLVPRS